MAYQHAAVGAPPSDMAYGTLAPAEHLPFTSVVTEVETGFDLSDGVISRSSPEEVVKLVTYFNRLFQAGYNSMVAVLICLCLVLAPFIGIMAGATNVLIRMLVMPFIRPMGDMMRIVFGRGGSTDDELMKLQSRYYEMQCRAITATRPVVQGQPAYRV